MPAKKNLPVHEAAKQDDRSELFEGLKHGILIAAAVLAFILPPPANVVATGTASAVNQLESREPRHADFGAETASEEAQFLAHWIADSGDNQQLSFVILDKKHAQVFVFNPAAKILGSTPVLLGAAKGDDSVPGIGKKLISQVLPEERTTPAGRFMGEPGRNSGGEDVVWVDYDAAVSMHRVRIVDPRERRLERLATPTPDDNRISYGCVNVPVAFFDTILSPQFKASYGVVYVLPEIKSMQEVFPAAYDLGLKYPMASKPITAPL